MAIARAERLVNLVLCLLSTRQYLTAERIRAIVPGYHEAPTDEAFFRMFERDKSELRDLGVPLETGRQSNAEGAEDGYRIARRDYELGDIDLEPDEAAAVALAARLWDSPQLTGAVHGALIKLRAAGVDVDQDTPAAVEPKVRANEPAFPPLLQAVQAGQVVAFGYRKPPPGGQKERTVEPWGVVAWRGKWYLVGWDRERQDTRCFRLSRVVGAVRTVGKPGAFTVPEGTDLMSLIARTQADPHHTSPAKIWVAKDRAQGLRRHAKVVEERDGGDVVEIDLKFPDSAAKWLAGFGPDVVVLEPEVLAKSVRDRLQGALEGAR
ncbi:transcriptional regulator [Lentzea albidocapillata subsp. violacea]|uniref:Transcriptional regulator n=1 Tax=Lentzea albidocapillata subsp. violacea TaxID=128104 RepID=A0A1G8Z4G2_9PSEU|nr:WYL domain-containing protein [Lentzea albidocapillata]SDK09928.1 transcriptional regulator [Lentzea albidocapillata subsp. violacea]